MGGGRWACHGVVFNDACAWVGSILPSVGTQVNVLALVGSDSELMLVASAAIEVAEVTISRSAGVVVLHKVVGLIQVGGVTGDTDRRELCVEGVVVDEEDTIVGILVLDGVLKGLVPVGCVIIRVGALILLCAPWVADTEELYAVDLMSAEHSVGVLLGKTNTGLVLVCLTLS